MFNKKLLGERIKKVRGKKSQDVFANEIGISRGALSYYENGERQPDAEIIYKICELCNVSADYLLGFTDNPTTDENLRAVCDYTGLSEEAVKNLSITKSGVQGNVTLSELITNGQLSELCEHLIMLKELSIFFGNVDDCTKFEFIFLFDSDVTPVVNKSEYCDIIRYRATKLLEKMLNEYDVREQVQDNGEHNPTEE